jgi:hypothetical protein
MDRGPMNARHQLQRMRRALAAGRWALFVRVTAGGGSRSTSSSSPLPTVWHACARF